MYKTILAGALAVSTVAGFASASFAETARSAKQRQSCQAAFAQNKAQIEALAAANNTAGIRAIMAKAGCSGTVAQMRKPRGTPRVKKEPAKKIPPRCHGVHSGVTSTYLVICNFNY